MEKIWLKNYPEKTPKVIDPGTFKTLLELFEHSFDKYADLPLASNMGTTLTYRELDRLSLQFSNYLRDHLKLEKGTRVAIMLPNILQYPIAMFGVLRAGLVVVNVNPLYTPRELSHQLSDSGAEVIVVLENFAHILEKSLPKTDVKHIIMTELGDQLGGLSSYVVNFVVKRLKGLVPKYRLPKVTRFSDCLLLGEKYDYVKPEMSADDTAFLQYTGGTTGVAKGAVLTHRNMVSNVIQIYVWVSVSLVEGQEKIVTALPLYHIFSLAASLSFFAFGCEWMFITNPRDLKSFVNTLNKKKGTVFVGVNTLFKTLVNDKRFQKCPNRHFAFTVAGGMGVQKTVSDAWQKCVGLPIIEGYGLTETSPVISVNRPDITEFNGSIGYPLPSTDVQIRDNENKELPLGEIGVLWVAGPQVMPGYYNKPKETAEVFDQDGWLDTGDLARMDEKGRLYLVDRVKEMINVSGFNVYPSEIEEVLSEFPGVLEVAVIGVPSERSGETVKAFIIKKQDAHFSEKDLMKYCREHLTPYKLPRIYEFIESLPKSNVGKVLKKELK